MSRDSIAVDFLDNVSREALIGYACRIGCGPYAVLSRYIECLTSWLVQLSRSLYTVGLFTSVKWLFLVTTRGSKAKIRDVLIEFSFWI